MKNVVIGTAGHIDHGKSSLIKALTGSDPDRWAEEKERGITLDLGFAHMENGESLISFVDVPGHERLVKNMIAGAVGFDVALFAVDASEKIKPQTEEHLFIIKTLGVKHAVVAVTKSDLLENGELEDSLKYIENYFSNAKFSNLTVLPTSIRDAESIKRLKATLFGVSEIVRQRPVNTPFILRIDRSFAVKGFGTVVTGTAVSGKVKKGESLTLYPHDEVVRVKGIKVHGKDAEYAVAGQRVALNIPDVNHSVVSRGCLLTKPGTLSKTGSIYVKLSMNDETGAVLRHNKTYPVYIGTEHLNGKLILVGAKEVASGGKGYALLKFDEEYTPYAGEKFLIRGLSPQVTIAGGKVLSVTDYSIKRKEMLPLLGALSEENYARALSLILSANSKGVVLPPVMQFGQLSDEQIDTLADEVSAERYGNFIIGREAMDKVLMAALAQLEVDGKLEISTSYPSAWGGKVVKSFVGRLIHMAKGKGYSVDGPLIQKRVKSPFEKLADEIFEMMKSDVAMSNPQVVAETTGKHESELVKVYQYLHNRDMIKPLDKNLYVVSDKVDEFVNLAVRVAGEQSVVNIKNMKEVFPASRKVLIALLEYLDRTGKFVSRDRDRILK